MISKAMVTLGASALAYLLPSLADADAVPPAAKGKSVLVTWTEDRVQRFLGTAGHRQIHVDLSMTAYVSSAGRIFNRITAQIGGLFGGTRSSDEVADDASDGFARRVARFEGRTLLVDAEFSGGARRIVVDFDGGFTSCTARIINGNESGAATRIEKGMVHGVMIEVLSITTGAAQCEIKDGNMFGSNGG
jgi:hypothetical protein